MNSTATPAQVATRQGMTTVLWRECRDCGQSKPETREHWCEWGKNGRPKRRVCKPCQYERNLKWQKDNPEKSLQRVLKWQKDNPEKVTESSRRYRQENAEKVAETVRRCRQNKPEAYAAQRRKYRQENAEAEAERSRKWSRKLARLRHRRDWELLPVDERAAALREILATGRWHALRVQLPHVVYLFTWPDSQYVGETRERRFEQRMSEHRTNGRGRGNPDVYAAFAQCEPRIQIIHHCENRDDALALEAQEIAGRRAAGITMFNIQHVVKENA